MRGIHSVVNLDTVGRLETQPVTLFGSGSATEWPHIFRGVSFETGIKSNSVPGGAEGSDQRVFLEKGIPAVQVFAQAHADYHTPSDTVEKLDLNGIVKVTRFTREVVSYLAGREEPLTGTGSATRAAPSSSGGRRVSLGTLPDFGFEGPGVRIDEVVPNSPAAAASLQVDDIIVAIDGVAVTDLRGYSETLKTFKPGQRVSISIRRQGRTFERSAQLEER